MKHDLLRFLFVVSAGVFSALTTSVLVYWHTPFVVILVWGLVLCVGAGEGGYWFSRWLSSKDHE